MKRIQVEPFEELINFSFQANACMVPSAVLAFQCKRLMDNLGCLAAGYDQNGVEAALSLARRWSGCSEASIIGSEERLAAPQAAFVNAVRSRALDFCDVLSPGWHPSSSDIPVALAAAELTGASGLEMLAALAIGQDFAQRINLAAQANGFFYRGFDSNILGLFSGAVIAARLLHLNQNTFADAIGLAFDFGIGTFQHYQDKTLAVRISQGLVARHALEAAMMAQVCWQLCLVLVFLVCRRHGLFWLTLSSLRCFQSLVGKICSQRICRSLAVFRSELPNPCWHPATSSINRTLLAPPRENWR